MRMNEMGESKLESWRHGAPAWYPSSSAPRRSRITAAAMRSASFSTDASSSAPRVRRSRSTLRLDAVRRVVGHLVVVSRDPETGRREGIEAAELVDVRVGEAKDLGHASSATTAPTPAIEATRSPSSSRMMITPRV